MNPRDVILRPGDRVEYVGPIKSFRGTHGTVQGPSYEAGRVRILWDTGNYADPLVNQVRHVESAIAPPLPVAGSPGCEKVPAHCGCLRVKAFEDELSRVNGDLDRAYEELAELRARDANAYMKAAAEVELRQANSRIFNAERRAEAAEREAREAKAKLARIKQVIE